MVEGFFIRKPFFEFGPKIYLYGEAALDMALCADRLCKEHGVDIIFSAQYTDIERIAGHTTNIKVFAQHMDPHPVGRGVGAVLAEALRHSGAQGVLLNHAEHPMTLSQLNAAIKRADEVGLASMVCAGTLEESVAVACLKPTIVLAESPALIGGSGRRDEDWLEIERINRAVKAMDDKMLILHAAGIADEKDVYRTILAGADGTGSTSGVLRAENPKEMLAKMIKAVRAAYDEREKRKKNGR